MIGHLKKVIYKIWSLARQTYLQYSTLKLQNTMLSNLGTTLPRPRRTSLPWFCCSDWLWTSRPPLRWEPTGGSFPPRNRSLPISRGVRRSKHLAVVRGVLPCARSRGAKSESSTWSAAYSLDWLSYRSVQKSSDQDSINPNCNNAAYSLASIDTWW